MKNKGLARFNAILEEQEQELERTIERNLKLLKERRQTATAAPRPAATDAADGADAAPTATVTATAVAAPDASANDDLIEQLRMLNDAMPKARRNTLYRCGLIRGRGGLMSLGLTAWARAGCRGWQGGRRRWLPGAAAGARPSVPRDARPSALLHSGLSRPNLHLDRARIATR